jgi:YjjG family noncanonical pyrimidine nucleotidase
MNYHWLLFDADNTLFDFDLAEREALRDTFLQNGLTYEPHYEEIYHRINEQIWVEFEAGRISAVDLRVRRFADLLAQLNIDFDPRRISQDYLPNLARCSQLINGAVETLQALSQHARLALITNGLSDVQRPRLKGSAISGLFAEVIISEEIGAAKPQPRFFEIALERIGRPAKEQVLVIGDGLTTDILGANRAGIDACWANLKGAALREGFQVKYEIHALPELVKIIL